MNTNLKKIAVEAMTTEQLCERLLRENLSYLQTANSSKPDAHIRTFISIDIAFTAGEMIEVARKIGMLPPAYDPQMLGFKDAAEAEEFRAWRAERDAAKHDLYGDTDKDRPDVICDRNGQVVLGLCKKCGRGEADLSEPCNSERKQ